MIRQRGRKLLNKQRRPKFGHRTVRGGAAEDKEAEARRINVQSWEPPPGMGEMPVLVLPLLLRGSDHRRGGAALPRLLGRRHQDSG